jgi:prephenate dehydratase
MSRPVAYLGPAGTFSHLVARKRFRGKANLVPQPGISAIFEFLRSDPAHRAVVPIENTSGGTIYDTVDLLIEMAGAVFIREEIALDVRMALLGRRGEPVRRIYSHFVQIHNHRDWFREHYPGVEIAPAPSTAAAAELAGREKGAAALAAAGAAQIYGLEILRRPSLAGAINVTHFVVLAQTAGDPVTSEPARTAVAVSFSNQCGSLYRFLEPFAKARVNINRIISRPFPGDPDKAVFFMEIDGAPGGAAFDAGLRKAVARSETFTSFGSYPWSRRVQS